MKAIDWCKHKDMQYLMSVGEVDRRLEQSKQLKYSKILGKCLLEIGRIFAYREVD